MQKHAILLGFGSQGSAWAECLKASGWMVDVYLPRASSGPESSWSRAESLGFKPRLMSELPKGFSRNEPALICALTPDHLIGGIYRDYLAPLKDTPLTLVLAHGYAVYAGELKP